MARKLSNGQLLTAFIALLVVVGIVKFWPSQEEKGTLNTQLVKPMDSGSVNRIVLLPEFDTADQVKLEKQAGEWKIQRNDEYKAVDPKRMDRALEDLYKNLKASRLVSRDKADWKKYEVDSAGTLMRVYQEGKLHDEVILGKLNFQNRKQAFNYVRSKGDQSVYAVDAYLKSSLKGTPKDWIKGKGTKKPRGKGMPPKMRQKMQRKQQLKRKLNNMNKDSLTKNLN